MCRTPAHQAEADSLEAKVAAFLQGGGAVTRYDNFNQVVSVATDDLPAPRASVLSEEYKDRHCGEFERFCEEFAEVIAKAQLPSLDADVPMFGDAPAAPAPVERPAVDVLAELRAIRREAEELLQRLEQAVARVRR